jgi:sulfite exporter TauE/SafE
MNIAAAILMGFLGSFHCVGMCGPIALALPLNRTSGFTKTYGALLYNSGRVFIYTCLGLWFGLVGKGVVIAGYQQFLSISAGSIILIFFLFSRLKPNTSLSFLTGYISKLKELLRGQFRKNSNTSLFITGILNGMLPCGLVYLGIAGAISTGDAFNGGIFMLLFGMGTLPAMLTIPLIGHWVSLDIRNRIRKLMPVFIISMALLLIVRGMNLGIPYISPGMSSTKAECHKCCKR